MPDKARRDSRLDRLRLATDAWANKERQRLGNEVLLLKKIMKGRTGADRLQNVSVVSGADLLVDELSDFLSGEDQ